MFPIHFKSFQLNLEFRHRNHQTNFNKFYFFITQTIRDCAAEFLAKFTDWRFHPKSMAVSIPLAIQMESKLGMGVLGIQTSSQKIRYRWSNSQKEIHHHKWDDLSFDFLEHTVSYYTYTVYDTLKISSWFNGRCWWRSTGSRTGPR